MIQGAQWGIFVLGMLMGGMCGFVLGALMILVDNLKEYRAFNKIQGELRECISHAYREEAEDIQEFGGNTEHLDKATHLLNELVKIYKVESEDK